MCDKCYGYIYDVFMDPLLNAYMDIGKLRKCSKSLINCLYRAINTFTSDESNMNNFKMAMILYEQNILRTIPTEYKEYEYDKWTWERFGLLFPKEMEELLYGIQICLDNNVVNPIGSDKHTYYRKEQYLTHYFMYKLRNILTFIPEIHISHIHIPVNPIYKSLGPVPQAKLIELRIRAGLPIDTDIDELYY